MLSGQHAGLLVLDIIKYPFEMAPVARWVLFFCLLSYGAHGTSPPPVRRQQSAVLYGAGGIVFGYIKLREMRGGGAWPERRMPE